MAPTSHPPNGDPTNDESVTVLVTGFGPFMDQFPVNPSFEIAKQLPDVLPGSDGQKTVRIITYSSPVKVVFDDVRELVPRLHDEYSGKVDVVLHIGMASERRAYTLERYAHRDGYNKSHDLNGKMPPPDQGEKLFGDCPTVLETSLKYNEIMSSWQRDVRDFPVGSAGHGADAQPSSNAGYYLCDYIYFQSLAYFARKSSVYEDGKDDDRPVLFFHVPANSDEKGLARGRAVAISLIKAIAEAYSKPTPNGVS